MIKFICYLEKIVYKYKRKYALKINEKFLKKYQLEDMGMKKKIRLQYNPYQPTGVFLIDSLIEKEYIKEEDYVLDVGSGTGVFLLYLATKGFKNLNGIEIDEEYYKVALNNQKKVHIDNYQTINFECADFFECELDKRINVFYLFNTFYDKETYLRFLEKVKISLDENPRKIKIIILFPTISSISALQETKWLYQLGRVFNQYQVCSKCNYFLIYTNHDKN